VNKAPDAESRFKEVTEAYEVLGSAENRGKYDQLGANWRAGQEFTPPPGWEGGFDFRRRPAGMDVPLDEMGGFSDFFEALFGLGGGTGGRSWSSARARRGEDHEAQITISLAEAHQGAKKSISLESTESSRRRRSHRRRRTYQVAIPPGTTSGARIRLAGQGGAGGASGKAGDLYLRVHVAAHPVFELKGRDLEMKLSITPWEAALGARVPVGTLGGKATLTLPPGTQSGQRFRLRGKGLAGRGKDPAGDLLAEVLIKVPQSLSARERELFEALGQTSRYDPRGET
jgi:curved DNA-binding protein